MKIRKALYHILSNHSPLTDLVGDRIFFLKVPQHFTKTTATPCVVYNLTSGLGNETKSGPSTVDQPRVQLDFYAKDPDDLTTIAEEAREALDYYSGTVGGVYIDGVKWDTEQSMYDEDLDTPRLKVDYLIRYHRT